jgi:hypothetical protein
VDSFLASQTLKFNSWVAGGAAGTGGTNAAADHIITNAPQFNGAYTRLRKQGVPGTDLSATLNFDDAEAITGSLTSAYLPPTSTSPRCSACASRCRWPTSTPMRRSRFRL